METRFLIKSGERRTLFRCKALFEVGIKEVHVWVIGNDAPLPTRMEEGIEEVEIEEMLAGVEDMWDDAPVSKYQSEVLPAGLAAMLFSTARRAL